MGHALQLPELVVAELLVQGPVDLPAVRELRLVLHPLPELGAGDLRGGRVLHQVEDRRRAVAGEPGGQILQRSEEHTSELQSPCNLVCRLLLEKKKKNK